MLQQTLFRMFRTERNVRATCPTRAQNAEVSLRRSRSQDADARRVRLRMRAQPSRDGLNLFAQRGVRELRLSNRKREVFRLRKRAFIKRIGEVVVHDGCSRLNKKGYQRAFPSKAASRAMCVGKGNQLAVGFLTNGGMRRFTLRRRCRRDTRESIAWLGFANGARWENRAAERRRSALLPGPPQTRFPRRDCGYLSAPATAAPRDLSARESAQLACARRQSSWSR